MFSEETVFDFCKKNSLYYLKNINFLHAKRNDAYKIIQSQKDKLNKGNLVLGSTISETRQSPISSISTTNEEYLNLNTKSKGVKETFLENTISNLNYDFGKTNGSNIQNNVMKSFPRKLNHQLCKSSMKSSEFIKGVVTYSDRGFNNANEDRLFIILNAPRPDKCLEPKWRNFSLFCLFDGHNGALASQFCCDHFYNRLINDASFISNTESALVRTFLNIDQDFFKYVNYSDYSGNSAICLLNICNSLWIANCGDSKSLLSTKNLSQIIDLNLQDYICDNSKISEIEKGMLNQLKSKKKIMNRKLANSHYGTSVEKPLLYNFSKAIGDFAAKQQKTSLKQTPITAFPRVTQFEINCQNDFLLICSEGIHKYLNSIDILSIIKNKIESITHINSLEVFCKMLVESIINKAFDNGSQEDITLIFVPLSNLKALFKDKMHSLLLNSKIKDAKFLVHLIRKHQISIIKVNQGCSMQPILFHFKDNFPKLNN